VSKRAALTFRKAQAGQLQRAGIAQSSGEHSCLRLGTKELRGHPGLRRAASAAGGRAALAALAGVFVNS